MKNLITAIVLLFVMTPQAPAQTRVAKEQIEDAFLWKTGGSLYGDVTSATSALRAATFEALGAGTFVIHQEDNRAALRSDVDLVLDPTNNGAANAVIVPATLMEFPDFLGPKIHFYSHSYKIGVSPFTLDIVSDRDIRFHSDTVPDLVAIEGDEGDVTIRRHLDVGGALEFAPAAEGDKVRYFGTLYRVSVSPETLDWHTDRHFRWHGGSAPSAMALDTGSGRLELSGPLRMPVQSSLPGGEIGDLIYYDHPTDDNQDGAYVYTAAGWKPL